MSEPVTYNMHESGAIPGVPNPDAPSGLWPGGCAVTIDPDTLQVVSVALLVPLVAPQGADTDAQEIPTPDVDADVEDPGEAAIDAAIDSGQQ